MNHYDNPEFFAAYAQMSRSQQGLPGAGEWHQLEPLLPDLDGKDVLDLGCGYGWHCKYAADHGAGDPGSGEGTHCFRCGNHADRE